MHFAERLSGSREGCYKGLFRAAGSRGEQTLPLRELCFSYQQALAVSKQAAAIVAPGWAEGEVVGEGKACGWVGLKAQESYRVLMTYS